MNSSTDVSSNAGNHGTYVAGVAGLAMDNGVGNAGYCPGCRLMIVHAEGYATSTCRWRRERGFCQGREELAGFLREELVRRIIRSVAWYVRNKRADDLHELILLGHVVFDAIDRDMKMGAIVGPGDEFEINAKSDVTKTFPDAEMAKTIIESTRQDPALAGGGRFMGFFGA
jgi:hypothetical protein